MTEISPKILRELLRYEPETGKLFWRSRPRHFFFSDEAARLWNARYAGREALNAARPTGYLVGSVLGRVCRAHRVIWAMQTGAWPKDQIDHIDCNPGNNAWSNLREATGAENARNRRATEKTKSGVKGVFWDTRDKLWRACVRCKGKPVYSGYFKDLEQAKAAVAKARQSLHGDFARCN